MKKESRKSANNSGIMVYDMTSDLCVWSKAGVRSPMMCINAFDCLNCPVDRKMKADIRAGKLEGGRALAGRQVTGRMSGMAHEDRQCRHMLSGRVSVKYCINDYDCARCEYHQAVLDEGLAEPLNQADRDYAGGFSLARNYYYHRGHAWARVEYGGLVRVGLDDFAWRLFGPFDRLETPHMGQVVKQGEPGFGLVRSALSAQCLSPLEGIVVAVNPDARVEGGLSLDDAYDRGWLYVLETHKLRLGLRNLLFGEESRGWLEGDSARLVGMLSDEAGYELAAAGGRALPDIYGHVPELGWDRLKKEFLRT